MGEHDLAIYLDLLPHGELSIALIALHGHLNICMPTFLIMQLLNKSLLLVQRSKVGKQINRQLQPVAEHIIWPPVNQSDTIV